MSVLLNRQLELILLSVSTVIWILAVYRWRSSILGFIHAYLAYLRRSFGWSVWVLLMALTLLWLGSNTFLDYDESVTFNRFTYRGLFRSIATYPFPNNHVLHSVCTNVSWLLLGWTHSLLALRLPAILFSLFTVAFVSNVFLHRNRLLTVLFIGMLFWCDSFFVYSFQGRGYSLQGLLSVVGLAAVLSMRDFNETRRLSALMATNILGLYTSPSYLYVAFPLTLTFLIFEFSWSMSCVGKAIRVIAIGSATVVLLYMPIFLHDGLESVISNKFVKDNNPERFDGVFHFSKSAIDWVVLPSGVGIGLLVFTCVSAFLKRRFSWLLLLLAPSILMIVLRQIPPIRVLHSNGILVLVLFFILLSEILHFREVKPWILGIGLICLLIPAIMRSDERFGGSAMRVSASVRKMNKYVRDDGNNYTWKLHWLYKDVQVAHSRIKGYRLDELSDSPEAFPTEGVLFSSIRLDGVKCIDSLSSPAAYVYELK